MKSGAIVIDKITLRELLEGHPPVDYIQERTNFGNIPDGIFTGACYWTGTKLLPLDGDYYSLDAEVIRYKWEEDGSLTYWIETEWI